LRRDGLQWLLAGVAVFAHESEPCRLQYFVRCDETWATISASVEGQVGRTSIDTRVARNDQGEWTLNGQLCSAVHGCIDVDLNFSPSTNLLPIRRLNLSVGASSAVRAAWLRFPSLRLEPLEQTYTRLAETTFRYASAGGEFVADIEVDDSGLVKTYGNLWMTDAII
jgi:hypothetical protein